MGTTAEKLAYLNDTKVAIHDAIITKGVDIPVGTPFRDYAVKIENINQSTVGYLGDTWTRPVEWLPMSTLVGTDNTMEILLAISDTDQERVAFELISTGTITVDWGDGSQDVIAGTGVAQKFEHLYDYANVNLNSDTVSNYGYKQCKITITSSAAITSFNNNTWADAIGNIGYHVYKYLDMVIGMDGCTDFVLSRTSGTSTVYAHFPTLQHIKIVGLGATSLSYRFKDLQRLTQIEFSYDMTHVTNISGLLHSCIMLESLVLPATPNITTLSYMITGCISLRYFNMADIGTTITSLSTSGLSTGNNALIEIYIGSAPSLTTIFSLFDNMSSLQKVTLLNTPSLTLMHNAFSVCTSLVEVNIDFSTATITDTMFSSCTSLTTINANLLNCTDCDSMFLGCTSLKEATINIPSCTTATKVFYGCINLEKVTITNSNLVTTMFEIFRGCNSLPKVTLDASSCSILQSAFYQCYSLVEVNITTTSALTNLSNAFNDCRALKYIPNMDTTNVTSFGTALSTYAYGVAEIFLTIRLSTSIAYCSLDAASLNSIFTNLPDVTATPQTLTVTGNRGVNEVGYDPSIASAKGWTIVS